MKALKNKEICKFKLTKSDVFKKFIKFPDFFSKPPIFSWLLSFLKIFPDFSWFPDRVATLHIKKLLLFNINFNHSTVWHIFNSIIIIILTTFFYFYKKWKLKILKFENKQNMFKIVICCFKIQKILKDIKSNLLDIQSDLQFWYFLNHTVQIVGEATNKFSYNKYFFINTNNLYLS